MANIFPQSRIGVNSLFGDYTVTRTTPNAIYNVDPNDPRSDYGKYYDYALRMSNGHQGLQRDIIQAKDKLDMKYNTQNYIDRKNEAIITDIAVPLRNKIRESLLFYLDQGYEQEEAMKRAKRDGDKYREILNTQFKEKYPRSTKDILKNMHVY